MMKKSLIKKTGRGLVVTSLILFSLFIITAIGLFLVRNTSTDFLNQIDFLADEINFYTQFIRWFMYAAVWLFWEPVIRYVGKSWDVDVLERAMASRKSTVLMLIAVEILLIQSRHISF